MSATLKFATLTDEVTRRFIRIPFLLYGTLLFTVGIAVYLFGVVLVIPRRLFGLNELLMPINEWIVWYSGMPTFFGAAMALFDILVLLRFKRQSGGLRIDPVRDQHVTVALTAYDDELSIADAVRDFVVHPLVRRVLVVSNNSRDATIERAHAAGAVTYNELSPGYGRCVFRCLTEAARFEDTELVVLCEGDRTFSAADIDKLLAYVAHADIVNGTRTVERMRANLTQLSTFMYYGNLYVGKLLEEKHLGFTTITDVGTTYKLIRRRAIPRLLAAVDPAVNLEFNAHLLDIAMQLRLTLVECPITFHPRVGESKGGNTNNRRALKVGLRMVLGIVFGWRFLRRQERVDEVGHVELAIGKSLL
jgi:hypothetical protein